MFSISSDQTLLTSSRRGAVVEKICEYLVHKNTYDNAGPKDDVPEFTTRIPPEMALELYACPLSVMYLRTHLLHVV
jgi:hypothetical protein